MRSTFTFIIALLTLLTLSSGAFAQDIVDPAPFDALLKKHVNKKGNVDYATLKKDKKAKAALDAYVAAIASAKPTGSKDAKLAFYVNAYNANVIKSVVDKYPIESVMKVDGFFKKEKHTVGGKPMTLDALEHKLIRPQFKEPRIHFVLVCAARSCPRLQREAATEKNIEALLEGAAKEFIPRATKVEGKTVTTSKLFEWFADDFKNAEGSVQKYLAKYLPKHKDVLLAEDTKLKFAHYSWKLNKQ